MTTSKIVRPRIERKRSIEAKEDRSRPNPDHTTTEWVPVSDLIVDRSYQRSLEPSKVLKIATEFDPDAFGVLIVSKRADGRLALIDGGHRVAALYDLGWDDQKVEALVHHGLDIKREAEIFVEMNLRRTKPKPAAIFTAEVQSEAPGALEVQAVLDKHNIAIAEGPYGDGLRSIGTVRKLYDKGGAELLDKTLGTLVRAYGHNISTFNHDLMFPLAALIWNNPDTDLRRLADTLRLLGTPPVIVGRAKSVSTLAGTKTANQVVNIIVRQYNKALRSRRISEVHDTAYLFGKKALRS